MSTPPVAAPRSGTPLLRRVIVAVIIAAFSIAALAGIIVLLGGELGEPGGKVLLTTAAVGMFSTAVLCCTALVGRRLQAFGLIGAGVSVATLAVLLVFIWSDFPGYGWWEELTKVLLTGVTATIALSLASLLLLLSDRRRPAVRWGLWITLGLFAVAVAMIWYLVWWSDTVREDTYARVLGVVAILAALGAVVVPVMSLLLPDGRAPRRDPVAPLSPELTQRLQAEASRRGITVEQLVAPVLDPADPAAT